jgi:hypothetical protein
VGVFFQKQRQESGDRSKPYELTPNLDIMAKKGAKFRPFLGHFTVLGNMENSM